MAIRCWTVLTLLVALGCGPSDPSPATQKAPQTRAAGGDEERTPQPAKPLPETVKGKSLQQWVHQLGGGTVLERREAAEALQKFDKYPGDEIVHESNRVTGAPEPTRARDAFVEALAKALSDADFQVRRDAAHVLGKLGPKAKAAEPALRKALKDEEAAVREAAAQALKRIDLGGGRQPGRSLSPLARRELAQAVEVGPVRKFPARPAQGVPPNPALHLTAPADRFLVARSCGGGGGR
jgi:hypothetical protein